MEKISVSHEACYWTLHFGTIYIFPPPKMLKARKAIWKTRLFEYTSSTPHLKWFSNITTTIFAKIAEVLVIFLVYCCRVFQQLYSRSIFACLRADGLIVKAITFNGFTFAHKDNFHWFFVYPQYPCATCTIL